MVGDHSLWGEVLLGKYGRDGWNQGKGTVTPNDSALLKAIVKSWPKLEHHKCWSLGDGSRVKFWTDKWINEQVRISDFVSNIPEDSHERKVHDVSTRDGRWNFNLLHNLVPDSIIQKIHAIVPPHDSYVQTNLYMLMVLTGLLFGPICVTCFGNGGTRVCMTRIL
jgi:hypothetical protein